jgi:alcohol dehydrogenase
MNGLPDELCDLLKHSRTRVVFGAGMLSQLGALARGENASRALLVTDRGIVAAGHVDRAVASLKAAGVAIANFDGVAENPTTEHVDVGVAAARAANVDFLIGLGGGSSLDCAKGINFVLTNGGRMQDYWGDGKATRPMLPMIAVPTTAGTGSEAQSFALICDPVTHQKMACGDSKAACRIAILDPDLTRTVPPKVAAATGIDAVSHAIETASTTRRNEISLAFSREAWTRLDRAFERAIGDPSNAEARTDMLLGAHLAGCAIEHSMLGAAHACANPLTARFGITHGIAVGIMLPQVVRFNGAGMANAYEALGLAFATLADRVEKFLKAAELPRRLRDVRVPEDALATLAEEAAQQWTATFNPTKVGARELLTIYQASWA